MLLDIGGVSGGGSLKDDYNNDDDYINDSEGDGYNSTQPSLDSDGGVQTDGSIKGSGQVDGKTATKDSISTSGDSGPVTGKSHGSNHLDSKVPTLPEGDGSTPPPGGKVDSYFTGASIMFFAIIAQVMDQVKRLTQQINATETKFQNTNNIASRDAAKEARDQGYDAASDKETGGLMSLGLSVASSAVGIGVGMKQAKNLSDTQAAAKGGVETGALDEAGAPVTTEPNAHAWEEGRMKADNLSTVSQISSGLGGGLTQGAQGVYEASSMENQADQALKQDAGQALGKGADAAQQDKKDAEDTGTKALDALADAFRKAREAAAQLVKG